MIYKLRNGMKVKLINETTPEIEIVFIPKNYIDPYGDVYETGEIIYLLPERSGNGSLLSPTTWKGGAFGTGFDIIKAVKK